MGLDEEIKKAYTAELIRQSGNPKILQDRILFHGSRGGIEGDIMPNSRERCDFGKGFYLGEDERQAKGLIVEDADPILYKIKLHISEMNPQRILYLKDEDWLTFVLAHRKKVPEFNRLDLAKRAIEKGNKYDIIIGKIADDRMSQAMSAFVDRALTDKGLYECLQFVDYGNQYVLKTKEACQLAEIMEEKELRGFDREQVRKYTANERKKAINLIDAMIDKYQRTGLYLNEIIKNEQIKNKEVKHVR